jgi:hypothetical protein
MMEHWNTGELKIQIENTNSKTNPKSQYSKIEV